MIKQITDISLLRLSDSYYGGKIAAYAEAYGLNYDFCRFYRLKNGTLMINNSNCVIDGRPPVNEELRFFIKMNGISAVESPLDIRIGGYSRHMRTVFEIKPCGGNINGNDIRRNSGFEEIYSVLNGSFGDIPHDLWYSDISHRVRHGVSETFLYRKTAAVLDFVHCGYGWLSNIATLPEYRNCGSCRKLLTYIAENLSERNIIGRLMAYDDKVPFYSRLGFEPVGKDIYLTLNEMENNNG